MQSKRQAHAVQYFGVAKSQKGLGVLHLEVAGRREWPKSWESPRIVSFFYTTYQDKSTPALVGKSTCDRLTVDSGDSQGPHLQYTVKSQACTK